MPDPVKWDSENRSDAPVAPGARMILDANGAPKMIAAWIPPGMPAGARCEGSLVAVQAKSDTAYAAWWMPRADSSALLVVARSDDGGHAWREPEVADSTDHGRTGCTRLPPYVTADTANGYVHVVYFMVAAEGAGIFFTHSMGQGEMFHSPVPIVYGEKASAAAVASYGDTVVVAYMDPNAAAPQVWLALSRTQGHIFEERVEVSPATAQVGRPAVAVRGHRVSIAWVESSRGGGAGVSVARTGQWQ